MFWELSFINYRKLPLKVRFNLISDYDMSIYSEYIIAGILNGKYLHKKTVAKHSVLISLITGLMCNRPPFLNYCGFTGFNNLFTNDVSYLAKFAVFVTNIWSEKFPAHV